MSTTPSDVKRVSRMLAADKKIFPIHSMATLPLTVALQVVR